MSDAITLRGMQFLASVGILEAERAARQPLEVDLTVWLERPLARGGAPADTVDYRRLYDLAARVVGGSHTDYLEELALALVEGALAEPLVARAKATVRKPHVPLPGPLAAAEVEVERARHA